ncbi:MAG: hypothetical protein WD208_09355 [Dehalococcoidia bacterium]
MRQSGTYAVSAGFGHLVIVGLMLLALVYPMAGPALDHHFAERMPHHDHVALNGTGPEHSHDPVRGHTHNAGDTQDTELADAVPTISSDANSHTHALSMAITDRLSAMAVIAPGAAQHFMPIRETEQRPLEFLSHPPTEPPQA